MVVRLLVILSIDTLGKVYWLTILIYILCPIRLAQIYQLVHLSIYLKFTIWLPTSTLDRVLCHTSIKIVRQSTLSDLFCITVAEYSARGIQTADYNLRFL